jgi:N-methylhydantoinase B
MEIPGGAGFGPPQERALEEVERDLLQGLVTPEAATLEYCVAADPATGGRDQVKTAQLRGNGER